MEITKINRIIVSLAGTIKYGKKGDRNLVVAIPLTSMGRGAPKVANPTFPGANVALPGSETP